MIVLGKKGKSFEHKTYLSFSEQSRPLIGDITELWPQRAHSQCWHNVRLMTYTKTFPVGSPSSSGVRAAVPCTKAVLLPQQPQARLQPVAPRCMSSPSVTLKPILSNKGSNPKPNKTFPLDDEKVKVEHKILS